MKRRAPWSMARLLVLLVLAVVMVSAMGTVAFAQEADSSAEKECYLNGDMNVDGSFNTEDAIYTLFHTFFGEGMYPVNQDCDINADEKVDTNDAIALLYAAFFKDTGLYPEYEQYGETAHDYYDPAWSWEETAEGVTATVTLQCACGEGSHALDAAVTAGETVAATCTAAGSQAYTATVTVDGETFTGTYSQIIAAAGHVAGEAEHDENQHYTLCANCGEKLNVASHSWEAEGEPSAATCQVAAVQNYKCSCGAAKSEELGFAEHAYQYEADVLVEGATCRYAKQYKCEICGDIKLTDEYDSHNYVAAVKEATCQADGEKVYQCSLCGAVEKTETIAKGEDKHIWDAGVEAAGVITYTCTVDGCGATKTAVTTSEDGTVSKDALQNADQLEVGGATLEMDEAVKDGLDDNKEIQITVESMDVADAEAKLENALTEEQKEQIGDNLVYDFNMSYSDGQKVDFDGWITVSLPYTLAEGEDVDAIDVWYIADDGTLEKQTATYSNGYVTFQTNHFSYYTVTRLTPAERCERYGHIWTDANKAATCTADGYTKKVCQRCGEEDADSLVVIGKTGHDYKTTETAATCEKFGSVVEKCANCGHTKSTVTPALGHDMQLSETVEATCDAAGKKVYACANGCGHTTEEAIPQLTHSYKKDETKTVAATCTAGGYDVHVCEHCGDEIRKNETTPLGHSYGADSAVWAWADDDGSATLTLTCDNECGSTKELNAAIAVVKATCLGEGSVKASVFYNNKSYSEEKVSGSATGHKPGSQWNTTESQHYYKCENCGEMLDVATHDFDDGVVTKEPTCTEAGVKTYTCAVCGYSKEEAVDPSGKHSYDEGVVTKAPTCAVKGTKLYTCTVCGFTKEETVAATGEHSYVNGICSVCGKDESACNHYRTTATLIDISAFDICDGMEIYEVSCECGQNRYLEIPKFACEMITISEGYSEDGTSVTYIEECSKCGLRAESGYYIEKAPDACRAQYVEWGKLILGDATVAEFSVVREESDEHPVYIVGESTVLSGKGMCDLTIITASCPCGENTGNQVRTSCTWYQIGENSLACEVCGAVYAVEGQDSVKEGCQVTDRWHYTYTNQAGELVYEYTYTNTYTEHYDQVTDYELYGDSCEDGIWVEYTCTECGEVHDEYNEGGYHPMVESTVTDLEDAKICASAHIQESCACGEAKENYLHYNVDDEICQWAWVASPDESKESDTEYYQCSICGAIKTEVYQTSEKDANCQYQEKITYIYVDADGSQLVTGETMDTYTEHNMKYDYELKGESCEDGVTVTEYCTDCGMSGTWTIEHHEVFVEEYDLAELGFCGGYVSFYSCPCGEESWAEVNPWGCAWTGMGDEGWTYHECLVCGGIWEVWYEEVQIDDCHSQTNYTHSFRLKDGTEVLKLDYAEKMDEHRWVTELTMLEEGATSCMLGYHGKQTCLTCGEVREWDNTSNHATYPTNRELIEGVLCGDVELVTYSCACGYRTRTNIEWIDGQCNFVHTNDEGDDCYIYTCLTCGAVRYERNYHEQVEGGTVCEMQHRWEYTYYLNDEELFVQTGVSYYDEHEWDYEFTLLGESCEDGVIIKQTCTKCGHESGEDTIYHHEVFGEESDLAELGFCGGYVSFYSCPCGYETHAEVVEPWGCEWTTDTDEEGHMKHICQTCGAVWEVWYEEVQIDDCHSQTNFTHSFQKDGEEVLRLEWTESYNHHDYESSFTLLGETCEDGVIVSTTCARCGYSFSEEVYHHGEFLLEEYDFAGYGFCDGYLQIFGCPCGENRWVDYYASCTWYGKGGFGEDVNSYSDTCANCGMIFTMTWADGVEVDSCHTRVDRTVSFAKDDVVLGAEYHETTTHHRFIHSLSLQEGSTSCLEGFWVNRTCMDCSEVNSQWGSGGDHSEYIISRQPVDAAGFCGEVEMLTYACACGEKSHEEYELGDCQFQWTYDEERGEIYACANCGVERVYEYTEVPVEGETCKVEYVRTYTYVKDGEALLSYTTKEVGYSHIEIAQYTLLVDGGTCDDGYTITWVCHTCGEVTGTSGTNYGCSTRRVARELLASKDVLCGDLYKDLYSCACGANTNEEVYWANGNCQFQDIYDEELGEWIYTCVNCGVERKYEYTREPIEGAVCQYQCSETYTYLRDGAELFTYTRSYTAVSHNSVALLTLQVEGGTCDDGYTVAWVCADCGQSLGQDPEVYYGCSTYKVSRELLASKDVLCGDLYLDTYSCACGKVSNSNRNWSNGSCSFQGGWYDEEDQSYLYTCTECGAYRREYNEDTMAEGSRCQMTHTWNYLYYDVNGNYLFTDAGSNTYHSPSWVYTLNLIGETCDEGYTRSGTCAYCGLTYEDTGVFYGCSTDRVEIAQIVADNGSVCGPIELHFYSCACGESSWWTVGHDCSFGWIGNDESTGNSIYQCSNCGVTYTENNTTVRQPGTCQVTQTVDLVYTITDGEETVQLGSISRTFERREHTTVCTLTLADGAISCEGGYYRSEHCIYCDYTWSSDEIRYDHGTWRIAYYDLMDYGMCGGSVEGWSCACGQNQSWSNWYGNCDYTYTGEQNEYGVSECYCQTCNTYFYMNDMGEHIPEECRYERTLYARLVRDGEVLLDLVQEYGEKAHTMVAVSVEGTCEDRVTVYAQCYYCGEQYTWDFGYNHGTYVTDFLDLKAAGACGGYVAKYTCQCGEEDYVGWNNQCILNYSNWSPEEIDGVTYYSQTRTCETCGLVIKATYYDAKEEGSCYYQRVFTYEYWMGETLLKVFEETNKYEDHDYVVTDRVLEGASCEDGVVLTYTCTCGASYTQRINHHEQYLHEDQSIDLTQYGSVCGCELQYYACACGQNQRYQLSDESCDLDLRSVSVWLEDALNDAQWTTEGWISTYSYAYTYTCAVTDPQCGLKIRMGDIWLKGENCTAVQYQIWQLGYQEIVDEATGEVTYTWEREIMIPTGEVHTFHDYVYTSGTNTLDDGTQVNYQDYLCNDCGSSYHVENHYVNGDHTYSESICTNTLDNGQMKKRSSISVYGFVHNGSRYETLRTETYIYADGTEWWEKRESSYTSEDVCRYVYTVTNSDGYSYTDEVEHYFTTISWTWEKEPTCSQPGVEMRTETCQLCGEVVDVQYYDRNPHCHSWYWNWELGVYECTRCGLENSNGADGTIVVEDLTAAYGNGTDHVVGYWNQGDGEFTVYASVILDDVTDDNDEIVLTGIDFTYLTVEKDGINAISTSQSVIQEAAKTAIANAGYTGSYAIRIAFVPADSDGTLDYAITFDSQTA